MSYRITKSFDFSASHQLEGLPDGHQCGRLHGHNYSVELELSSESLDAVGFVTDYGDLNLFGNWLKVHFDHRHLNDEVGFNPTAEILASHLYGVASEVLAPQRIVHLDAVRVHETPKTMAEYRP
jgi:6-pyruvoyltetrahydropterin/6-carboxytetrahydropterin synthase